MINETSTSTSSFRSSNGTTVTEASSNQILDDDLTNKSGLCAACCSCFSSSSAFTSSNQVSSCDLAVGSVRRKRRINPIVKLIKLVRHSKYTKLNYYKNNLSFFLTIFVYLLIQVMLVLIQMHIYWNVNLPLKFARAGGILLNFNSGLIIVLVLRRLVTWVRNSFIGRNYLPVDDFIRFHKFLGIIILLLSIEHTLGHCVNLCKQKKN
jgi:hypothetical protein